MLFFPLLLASVPLVAGSSVKIMSFNIDCRLCDIKHENGDSWSDRVDNVKDTISRHNPDIIGIQVRKASGSFGFDFL